MKLVTESVYWCHLLWRVQLNVLKQNLRMTPNFLQLFTVIITAQIYFAMADVVMVPSRESKLGRDDLRNRGIQFICNNGVIKKAWSWLLLIMITVVKRRATYCCSLITKRLVIPSLFFGAISNNYYSWYLLKKIFILHMVVFVNSMWA